MEDLRIRLLEGVCRARCTGRLAGRFRLASWVSTISDYNFFDMDCGVQTGDAQVGLYVESLANAFYNYKHHVTATGICGGNFHSRHGQVSSCYFVGLLVNFTGHDRLPFYEFGEGTQYTVFKRICVVS